MPNILIVESENDKIFFEALIKELKLNEVEVDAPIYIDDYQCLSGLSKEELIRSIKSVSSRLVKNDISKIGIIIDQDYDSQEAKLELVNDCLNEIFTIRGILQEVGKLYSLSVDDTDLKIGTYFVGIG